LTIKSDSEKKTHLIIKLAEDLGLQATLHELEELNAKSLAEGIGRKANDEELTAYLSKGSNAKLIDLDIAFSK
jgi:hypothetical protein